MAFKRLQGLALCAVLAASGITAGCMPEAMQKSAPEKQNRLQIREATAPQTLPLRKEDYKTFQDLLFVKLNMTTEDRNQFRVLETANVRNGTYLIYSTPHADGLAFAGRNVNGLVTIFEANLPFSRRDDHDLIVARAIPPNSNVNPGYGVLAGRVFSPFIENVEVAFRDGQRTKVSVGHSRSFLIVRKAFDTRFAQVKGYDMNGNPYWELDTR